eukprot:COSAG06_NODE_5121_length_3705_cov_5.169994_1_plen_129_part_00
MHKWKVTMPFKQHRWCTAELATVLPAKLVDVCIGARMPLQSFEKPRTEETTVTIERHGGAMGRMGDEDPVSWLGRRVCVYDKAKRTATHIARLTCNIVDSAKHGAETWFQIGNDFVIRHGLCTDITLD